MGPSVKGMLTLCSSGSASLNKMAAMPINVFDKKHLKFFFSSTKNALKLILSIQLWGLNVFFSETA